MVQTITFFSVMRLLDKSKNVGKKLLEDQERHCYTSIHMKPARNTVLVELHVPDFGKVKDYYGKIGFEVVRGSRPKDKDGYLVLKLEDNILCFWGGNDEVYEQSYFKRFPRSTARGYGVEIVILVSDVESHYQRVKAFANVVSPLSLRPWGLKDFRIVDPFGYYLRVTSIHDVLSSLDTHS